MTFVSHAQNFEDVMLWRAFKRIGQGFYIDVGAWSPDRDSVTRAFYERGWRGINIEPNPEFQKALRERRPEDINLPLGICDQVGTLTMNFLGNSGLSTFDEAIADKHQQVGWSRHREEVPVTTLAEIWRIQVPTGQPVHFLKVDAEGFEEAVLRGNDWSNNRPWVVLVEATLPMSQIESHAAWEPILLQAHYRHAYSDGLNRYYVADEHVHLLSAFRHPPNVFDGFVLAATSEAEARAQQAEAQAQLAEARAKDAETQARHAEARAQQAEAQAQLAAARAQQAEAQAQLDAARAQHAEAQAQLDAARAQHAEAQAQEAEAQARQAEAEARQAEAAAAVAEAAAAAEAEAEAEAEARQAEGQIQRLQRTLQTSTSDLHSVIKENQDLRNRLTDSLTKANHFYLAAESASETVGKLLGSTSWRITFPLRLLKSFFASLIRVTITFSHHLVKPLLLSLAKWIVRHPKLAHGFRRALVRFPRLYSQATRFLRHQLAKDPHPAGSQPHAFKPLMSPTHDSALPEHSARARKIYTELQTVLQHRQKKDT